jgi:hypothetical protein
VNYEGTTHLEASFSYHQLKWQKEQENRLNSLSSSEIPLATSPISERSQKMLPNQSPTDTENRNIGFSQRISPFETQYIKENSLSQKTSPQSQPQPPQPPQPPTSQPQQMSNCSLTGIFLFSQFFVLIHSKQESIQFITRIFDR